jgi:hypothetical protein
VWTLRGTQAERERKSSLCWRIHFGKFVWEYRNHQAAISRETRVAVKWNGRYNVLFERECWLDIAARDEAPLQIDVADWWRKGKRDTRGSGSWISSIVFHKITWSVYSTLLHTPNTVAEPHNHSLYYRKYSTGESVCEHRYMLMKNCTIETVASACVT